MATSSPAGPTARAPYSSPAREQQARATRRAIVAAAGELFVEQGYAATTIDAVAARAGVGRKTVFSSVGGKGALLKLAWDWALSGDDEPVAMSERPAVQAIVAERDPARLVRMWVDLLLDVGRRTGPLGAALLAAADVDDEAGALLDLIHSETLVGATAFVSHLAGVGGLRGEISLDRAADCCWALVNSTLLRLVVHQRGWSLQEYGDWLVQLASTTLLGPAGSESVRPQPTITTTHDAVRHGYEATVDGRFAGRLSYEHSDRFLIATRTSVEPAFDSLGVADALVRRALADVRADPARRVVAVCPYVSWWAAAHPEYAPLVLHE